MTSVDRPAPPLQRLILQVSEQVARGGRIEIVLRDEPFRRFGVRHAAKLTNQLANREPELHRTASLIAVPERQLAWLAWCG